MLFILLLSSISNQLFSSAVAQVVLDLLEALAVLSDTTVRSSEID